MNLSQNRGYKLGYEALEAWRQGLLDEAWYQTTDQEGFARRFGVNHFCIMALLDARRSAAVYLKASQKLLRETKEIELLEEMVGIYTRMHREIEQLYEELPSPDSTKGADVYKIWTQQNRGRQADLLQTLILLERKGDELARQILALYE